MHQLDEPRLVAQLEQILVQLEAGVVLLVLLPLQEILFLGAHGAVLQPFGIVAREDQLHGAEKPGVEFGPLVGNALADAVADGDATVFEFQHAHSNAVDVEHNVGSPFEIAAQRDFLGDGEVVL